MFPNRPFSFSFLGKLIVRLTDFSTLSSCWFLSNASTNSGKISAFVSAYANFSLLLIHMTASMMPSFYVSLTAFKSILRRFIEVEAFRIMYDVD